MTVNNACFGNDAFEMRLRRVFRTIDVVCAVLCAINACIYFIMSCSVVAWLCTGLCFLFFVMAALPTMVRRHSHRARRAADML